MKKVRSFEDLRCWQAARELVKEIYRITDKDSLRKEYSLKDQIQRAAISIMSNIAEGYARASNKEFVKHLIISRGSAAEVESLLYVLYDLNFISKESFEAKFKQTNVLSKQLNALISYTKKTIS